MSALSLRELATALGGDVQGRQVVCPGPNHSKVDRSLAVRPSTSSSVGFVVHSYTGDDFATCRDFVLQKLGMDLDAWRTRGRGDDRPTRTFVVPDVGGAYDDRARIARAVAIWQEGRDPVGTVVERYLVSRGLALPDSGADVLRYHPACPWGDKVLGRTIFVPAMVAAMRQIEGDAVTAIHRTRLTPEGAKVDRMMMGKASGAAIKLDADDEVTAGLHIAEGIETALAGRQLGFRPCWALGGAGGIKAFPVLGGVECLTLLAENDPTNAKAVNECGARWHGAGREVVVVEPVIGSDLNDAMRGVS